MNKRTRQFVFVAAGILVFGLGTGLIASLGGLQIPLAGGDDGPAELNFIPGDARALAYANVRQVMDSELRQKLMRFHTGSADHADKFLSETGINLQTDVDEVVVTMSGAGTEIRPLLIASGRFDNVTLESIARQHGAVVEEHRGTRLLVHEEFGIGFVKPGVVAVGTPQALRRAIDANLDGTHVRGNADVMKMIRDVDEGNAWSVAHIDAIAGGAQLPAEIARQLPPITWFSASGYVNGGVSGMVRAQARDETAAKDLREVLQGFIALARLQVGNRPELSGVLNSLQLGGDGTTVSLGFTVPSELIDALGALAAQHQRDEKPQILQERRELPSLPAL